MFESLDKLAPRADQPVITTIQIPRNPPQPTPNNKPGFKLGPSTRSKSHEDSDLPPSRFKEGDRVVVHNKNQIPIYGTVRWLGIVNTSDSKVNAVGIETVSKKYRIAGNFRGGAIFLWKTNHEIFTTEKGTNFRPHTSIVHSSIILKYYHRFASLLNSTKILPPHPPTTEFTCYTVLRIHHFGTQSMVYPYESWI